MAKIYFELILKGLWELENVPLVWRDKVIKLLEEAGYFNE